MEGLIEKKKETFDLRTDMSVRQFSVQIIKQFELNCEFEEVMTQISIVFCVFQTYCVRSCEFA